MRKKHTWIILFLFAGMMPFISCKKYLDVKSDSSLVIPTTLQDMQRILDDVVLINNITPSFGETYADDYFLTQEMMDGLGTFEAAKYTWTPQEYNYPNDWSEAYRVVYNANLCLEGVQKIAFTPGNSLVWNNVKGSALFFRAYYFLQLAWIHAKAYDPASYDTDLGIVLKMETDFNVPSVRSTVKQTYDRVIEDTKASVDLLPIHPLHVVRPSKAAAYGLLARAYLSMNEYDSAFKYADLALSIKSSLLDYNTVDTTSYYPFLPYNEETIFYTTMNTSNYLHFPTIGNTDTLLYASYDDNDLRKPAFFVFYNGYYTFKGNYTGDLYSMFSGIATDEMYLIRAEGHARKGNKDQAMDDLNTLLATRWSATVSYPVMTAIDANDALNKVLTERRKELVMRGLRWPDIKRLNKLGANIGPVRIVNGQTIVLPANSNKYAIPIPADIIRNSNVEQNPQ